MSYGPTSHLVRTPWGIVSRGLMHTFDKKRDFLSLELRIFHFFAGSPVLWLFKSVLPLAAPSLHQLWVAPWWPGTQACALFGSCRVKPIGSSPVLRFFWRHCPRERPHKCSLIDTTAATRKNQGIRMSPTNSHFFLRNWSCAMKNSKTSEQWTTIGLSWMFLFFLVKKEQKHSREAISCSWLRCFGVFHCAGSIAIQLKRIFCLNSRINWKQQVLLNKHSAKKEFSTKFRFYQTNHFWQKKEQVISNRKIYFCFFFLNQMRLNSEKANLLYFWKF